MFLLRSNLKKFLSSKSLETINCYKMSLKTFIKLLATSHYKLDHINHQQINENHKKMIKTQKRKKICIIVISNNVFSWHYKLNDLCPVDYTAYSICHNNNSIKTDQSTKMLLELHLNARYNDNKFFFHISLNRFVMSNLKLNRKHAQNSTFESYGMDQTHELKKKLNYEWIEV